MADGQAEAAWEEFDPGYSPYKGKADEMKTLFLAAYACGWEEAIEGASDMPSFEHMEAVAKLSALRQAARALLAGSILDQEWTAAYRALAALLEGAEADPDVADTAWAIIAHHRQHRTAG